MKVWMILAYGLIALALAAGYVLPMLFSAKSDVAVLGGVLIIPLLALAGYKLGLYVINKKFPNINSKKDGSDNA